MQSRVQEHGPEFAEILDLETHLVCYDLLTIPGDFVSRQARTANQFGEAELQTVSTENLCVPSTKELAP